MVTQCVAMDSLRPLLQELPTLAASGIKSHLSRVGGGPVVPAPAIVRRETDRLAPRIQKNDVLNAPSVAGPSKRVRVESRSARALLHAVVRPETA